MQTIHSARGAPAKPHFHVQVFVPGEVIDSEIMAMDKTSYNAVALFESLGYHLDVHPASEDKPLSFSVGSKSYVGISGVIEYLRSEGTRLTDCQMSQMLRRNVRDGEHHQQVTSNVRYLKRARRV